MKSNTSQDASDLFCRKKKKKRKKKKAGPRIYVELQETRNS